MIRQAIIDAQTDQADDREIDHDPHFRWRGRNVTRIENLSDIVFALALGMIVAGPATPVTVDDLAAHIVNIVPVSAAFAILLMIWNAHFVYFRRYALGDGRAIFLNAMLLLFILFIAYPLRFIFDAFFAYALVLGGQFDRAEAMNLSFNNAGMIMGVYAAGYAVIYAIIALMYGHALDKAGELGLSEDEKSMTRASIAMYTMQVSVALAIGALAVLTPLRAFAGTFFCLLWPGGALIGRRFRQERARRQEAAAVET